MKATKKRKFIALLTAVVMMLSCVQGLASPAYAAADVIGQNDNGHDVHYAPVTSLYSAGKPLTLFDATLKGWGGGEVAPGYLLNRFGAYYNAGFDMYEYGNFNGRAPNEEWKGSLKGPHKVWKWQASVHFRRLFKDEYTSDGNIKGLLDKGDVKYFFAYKIKTVETRWGIGKRSHDDGYLSFLGEETTARGGGWKYYNYRHGTSIPNLNDTKAWKDSSKLAVNKNYLYFRASSDRDANVDSYLGDCVFVGKDVQGPRINRVFVTTDAAGNNPLANNTVTLDNIKGQKDRIIYFQVEWDEPVMFRGISSDELSKLSLQIHTLGEDRTDGLLAEAQFLNFTPAKTDGKPIMTFEYKVPDPYTDQSQVTQERGFYYTFDKVIIGSSQNANIWNHLQDLSGNAFAGDQLGNQPARNSVTTHISGSPSVDFRPFAVENIRVTKDKNTENEFFQAGELLTVTLEINKPFAADTKFETLPTLTLNIKDKNGDYVKIEPKADQAALVKKVYDGETWKKSSPEQYWSSLYGYGLRNAVETNSGIIDSSGSISASGADSISYSVQLYPGYELDGDTIKVIKIESTSEALDNAGYSLMSYSLVDDGTLEPMDLPEAAKGKLSKYKTDPDKQYKVDYIDPEISISFAEKTAQSDVVMIDAQIIDDSLWGSDAAFTVSIDGRFDAAGSSADRYISYQTSSSTSYSDSKWIKGEAGSTSVSASAPIVGEGRERHAYLFVKLPEKAEISSLSASATASDEAGNTGKSEASFDGWRGFDNLQPQVSVSVKDEVASIEVTDLSTDEEVTYFYAWTENASSAPSSGEFASGTGKTAVIPRPEFPDTGDSNAVYERTLWVKAADRNGLESDLQSLTIKFDASYATVTLTGNEDKTYNSGDYPNADAVIENVKGYWYAWVEKPANYFGDNTSAGSSAGDTATDYNNIVSYLENNPGYIDDFKTWAQAKDWYTSVPDDTPDTPVSNNRSEFAAALTSSTDVVSLAENGDSSVEKWNRYNADSPDTYSIKAKDSARPIILLVVAEKDDGSNLVKAMEFDTYYQEPQISVRHYRYSSNDALGERRDLVRLPGNCGLYWPEDTGESYKYPINVPNLNDFVQAEFYIAGDPVTGLSRLDKEKTTISLVKIRVSKDEDPFDEYSQQFDVISTVKEWKLSELNLNALSGGSYIEAGLAAANGGLGTICGDFVGSACSPVYSATVDIDPRMINDMPYETDEEGYSKVIRYEFRMNRAYADGAKDKSETLSHFVFMNSPEIALNYIAEERELFWGGGTYYSNVTLSNLNVMGAEVSFDAEGKDITQNIPTVYFNGESFYQEESGSYKDIYIKMQLADYGYFYRLILGAPASAGSGADKGLNGSRLTVKGGSDPNSLTELDLNEIGDTDGCFNIGKVTDAYGTQRVYYKLCCEERNFESPLYVFEIKRDDEPPVIELTVSETEAPVKEVKIRATALYDGHFDENGAFVAGSGISTAYGGGDGSLYDGLYIQAFMYPPSESGEDDYYNDYVQVIPDEDGVYTFTYNGVMMLSAEDNAQNYANSFKVNGVTYTKEDGADFLAYKVTNIDYQPPEFTEEPQFTFDSDEGSFLVTASVDETAVDVYMQFDDEYAKAIAGEKDSYTDQLTGETVIVDNNADGYAVDKVPGLLSGGFDKDTGRISAKIYVKGGEKLSKIKLIAVDSAGNEKVYEKDCSLKGKELKITNTASGVSANVDKYPVYSYGGSLDFTQPVSILNYNTQYEASHTQLPILEDGAVSIKYIDLFNEIHEAYIYADIYGAAFAHNIKFTTGDKEITADMPVNTSVKVTIDTGSTENLYCVTDSDPNATVISEEFSDNGIFTYKLTNRELGETREFIVPVENIDKTAPKPEISLYYDSEYDEISGQTLIYEALYTIEGFDEEKVNIIDENGDPAPSSISFDANSAQKTYTFRFKDAAGNAGEYTVDASGIAFAERKDMNIAYCRLVYTTSDANSGRMLGTFEAGARADIGQVNSPVSVRLEAYNADGKQVPFVMSTESALPEGVQAFSAQKSIVFGSESESDRTVNVKLTGKAGAKTIAVTLPGGSIDMTAPTATVNYLMEEDEATGNKTVKAYLIPYCDDIAADGIALTGKKSDGRPLLLQYDDQTGYYYTTFDENGSGYFVLTDKAGNAGTVAAAVAGIDNDPPQVKAEGWSGLFEAKTAESIEELLNTPTNNSLKLFFTFDEQLSDVEIKAYDGANNELLPTEDYVIAAASGKTLTVEFKKNCQAQIVVADLQGNKTTLWRPEYGPVSVIDREAPKIISAVENFDSGSNKLAISYVFDKEVMLLQYGEAGSEKGYAKEHEIVFDSNGQKILNFADKAGNILNDYPTVKLIDEIAPYVKMNLEYVGEGNTLTPEQGYAAGRLYTSRDVRILLNVSDDTAEGISVTAGLQGGKALTVTKEDIAYDGKAYNYHFTVSENGVYEITAADKWGHKNTAYVDMTAIDRTAPTISIENDKAVIAGKNTAEDTIKKLLLEGVSAHDTQSGADSAGGSSGSAGLGVTLDVDLAGADLSKAGTYSVQITAKDRLGNSSLRTRLLVITDSRRADFIVNGEKVDANDVFATTPATITIAPDSLGEASGGSTYDEMANMKYSYAYGYKTAAQMKYASSFIGTEGFAAQNKGYYTILAQSSQREMYLIYIYVF